MRKLFQYRPTFFNTEYLRVTEFCVTHTHTHTHTGKPLLIYTARHWPQPRGQGFPRGHTVAAGSPAPDEHDYEYMNQILY